MRVILPLILFLLLCQPLFALDEPPTDLTAAGQTTDNKREGKWTFSDATGRKRFEIDYVRGLRTGAYIQWNEDGKLIVLGECFADKRHGSWTEFHDNGELKSEGEYFAGVRHGEWKSFYDNGETAEEGEFYEGHRRGLWAGYHSSGAASYQGSYVNGQRQGQWTFCFPDGAVQESGGFEQGVRTGRWREWEQGGTLVSDVELLEDKVVGVSCQSGAPPSRGLHEFHACSVSEGMRMAATPRELDGEPLFQCEVRVTRTGVPQVLILSGRGPIEWKLDIGPGVVIERVILAGKSRQLLLNAPLGLKVESKFEVDGDKSKLFARTLQEDPDPSHKVYRSALEVFLGHPVTSIHTSRGGNRFVIGRVTDRAFVAPEDAEMHVVGAYEGKYPRPRQFREELTGETSVHVARAGVPIVLVLCAYESIHWTVELDEGVELTAVILSGYKRQTVSGIPDSVKIINCDRDGGSGPHFYAYKKNADFDRIPLILRDLIGLEISSFQGAYSGDKFEVNSGLAELEPPPLDAEVHVLCVGKGTPVAGKEEESLVEVTVSGITADVVLVLGSTTDVTWSIKADDNVNIERIVLIGMGVARVRGKPAGCRIQNLTAAVVGKDFIPAVISDSAPGVAGMKLRLKDKLGLDVKSVQATDQADSLKLKEEG